MRALLRGDFTKLRLPSDALCHASIAHSASWTSEAWHNDSCRVHGSIQYVNVSALAQPAINKRRKQVLTRHASSTASRLSIPAAPAPVYRFALPNLRSLVLLDQVIGHVRAVHYPDAS